MRSIVSRSVQLTFMSSFFGICINLFVTLPSSSNSFVIVKVSDHLSVMVPDMISFLDNPHVHWTRHSAVRVSVDPSSERSRTVSVWVISALHCCSPQSHTGRQYSTGPASPSSSPFAVTILQAWPFPSRSPSNSAIKCSCTTVPIGYNPSPSRCTLVGE